jgi:hypothetical protein
MDSQVSQSTHGSKSQYGGKVPTFSPQETIQKWLMMIKVRSWLFWAKTCAWVVLRVGSSFLLDPLSTQVPSLNLQKVLPCRHPCHTWDLGLGTMCEMLSPSFQAINGWDCMDWPQVTWDTMWTGPKLWNTYQCPTCIWITPPYFKKRRVYGPNIHDVTNTLLHTHMVYFHVIHILLKTKILWWWWWWWLLLLLLRLL